VAQPVESNKARSAMSELARANALFGVRRVLAAFPRRLVAVEVRRWLVSSVVIRLARAVAAARSGRELDFNGDRSPAESGDKSPHSKACRAGGFEPAGRNR